MSQAMTARSVYWLSTILGVCLLASAHAQTPAVPEAPPVELPKLPSIPLKVPTQLGSDPLRPPPIDQAVSGSGDYFIGNGSQQILGTPPLPGSLEDTYARELAAREKFRRFYWTDGLFTALPQTLLWEPALAVKRDPKLQTVITNQKNYRSNFTVDTFIGGTMGVARYDVPGADLSFQFDMFGLVLTRLSPDDLMLADYRFGLPLTWKRGSWSGKIGYEHTSAHLGDELIARTGRQTVSWAKDELVLGLSRVIENNTRLYTHVGYAVSMGLPNLEATTTNRARIDFGGEWYRREPTGYVGTPFIAANIEFRGDQDFNPNLTLQAGWLWKNPFQRMGNARIFAEYYTGNSPYGQTFRDKESFASVGFGYDY